MATEEEKAAAAKARDSIQSTTVKKEEPVVTEAKEDEVVEEVKEEVIEEKVEASDEKVEELEEELEDKTLTAAERTRLEKRIQKEREKNKDLRDRLAAAEKQLADKPEGERTYTEEEVEQRAEQRAIQKTIEKEFQSSVKRIADSCQKIDKNFSEKVTAMVEDVTGTGSALPSMMVGILDDMPDHGGPVLMHLANNIEEYEEIYTLSPARMALKLKEISDNIIQKERKTKTKEISKVPEPKDGVRGKGTTPEQKATEKDDMATFIAKRNREAENHRRQKAGLPMLN